MGISQEILPQPLPSDPMSMYDPPPLGITEIDVLALQTNKGIHVLFSASNTWLLMETKRVLPISQE